MWDGGPDCPGIRTTEGKTMLHKSYKKSSLNSKVEILKAGIFYITVYNNNNNKYCRLFEHKVYRRPVYEHC
jgi:hypothetical protein